MNRLAVLAIVAAPLVAHADPPDDLGTPLPAPSAYPAMTGPSLIVMSIDAVDVPSLPPLDLGHGLTSPRRSEVFGGVGFRSYVGGGHMGRFVYYSMGGGVEGGVASGKPLSAGAPMLTGSQLYSLELPSPGYGYRTRKWLVGAQLVPAVEWIAEEFKNGETPMSGHDHFYTVSADFQACMQYTVFTGLGRNSAACVYVAPVIYRDGWFSGASFGVRIFAL
jgi:hypothetical protein